VHRAAIHPLIESPGGNGDLSLRSPTRLYLASSGSRRLRAPLTTRRRAQLAVAGAALLGDPGKHGAQATPPLNPDVRPGAQ